jgi:hypothetical protein
MRKKILNGAVQLATFVILANLPFLTISQILGIDTFLDSFQHPKSYQYLKDDKINGLEQKKGYLIFTTLSSQENPITEGDTILYRGSANTIEYRMVYSIHIHHGDKTYYTTTSNGEKLDGPIYNYQILGKTTGIIEDNLWNALSIHIWSLAIKNLNVVAFFP